MDSITKQTLRLSMHWTIVYNNFLKRTDPNLFNIRDYKYRYDFCEDMLQLQYKDDIVLDLGWYPEFDIQGYYLLHIIEGGQWDNPLYKYMSKDKNDIVEKIEYTTLHIEQILNKLDYDRYTGQWYCPVVNKVVHHVDCYEISAAGYKAIKKEALFVKVELDEWEHICDACINNPENV